MTPPQLVLALAGGVGGAKLALGLSRLLAPEGLTVVVNTGDDEEFFGLHVSPDLDTVMYTLAGLANPETGWGLQDESFTALRAYERLGGEAWFALGDQDLGTHLRRTELLHAGRTLSQVTADLCRRLGIGCTIAPMSDDRVRTIAITDQGPLAFQEYFVHRRCQPVLQGLRFDGIERARPSAALDRALAHAAALIVCPSNPFVSIGPILALPGVRDRIAGFAGARVVVSPIIAGQAVKGPAAKMLAELGEEPSALAVARGYRGLCDLFVLDEQDAALAPAVEALGMQTAVTRTLMLSEQDKVGLARQVLTVAGIDA
jgi:LPPG:FO 2-phospho-L-lactate transferase